MNAAEFVKRTRPVAELILMLKEGTGDNNNRSDKQQLSKFLINGSFGKDLIYLLAILITAGA